MPKPVTIDWPSGLRPSTRSSRDWAAASTLIRQAQNDWLDVEGVVKTRSADDYTKTEDEMWTNLCEAVEAGQGFSLEYGADQHHEEVMEWMLSRDYIVDALDEEDEDE
mgnify:CR=1 FL=1